MELLLSQRERTYLTVIKHLTDEEGFARLSKIAKEMSISPASAYEEINHLIKKGFVQKTNKGIKLTEEGEKELNKAIKAHRVVEYWLFNLGFGAAEACNYAKKFDYMVPLEVIEKLYVNLGKPETCPHGEKIPE
ncbi:MAG: metal-dependent transcriptional regulator [Sulfolobaceae archaeon]|nr:metal-dependent transcriptional regulator [Sulfolobaceae archaeon]